MVVEPNSSFLPDDIIFKVCHTSNFKTLASLARVHKPLQRIAEEILYRKDVELPGTPAAALWAARYNLLPTLTKALQYIRPASIRSLVEARAIHIVPDIALLSLQDDDEDLLEESEGESAKSSGGVSGQALGDDLEDEYLRYEAGTALHEAAARGHDSIVRRLLEFGADTEARADFRGTFYERGTYLDGICLRVTPLFLALFHKKEESASLLLRYAADHAVSFEVGNNRPAYSALHLAIHACSETIVDELLTQYLADVNWGHDSGSWLPIHITVTQAARVKFLRKLLYAGARVDTYISHPLLPSESTIVHLLALLNDETAVAQAVNTLVLAGADIHGRAGGMTLLHVAAASRNPSMLKVLLHRGFDVKAKTDGGQGALDLLAKDWHRDGGEDGVTKETYIDRVERTLSCVQILIGAGVDPHPSQVNTFVRIESVVADVLYQHIGNVLRVGHDYWFDKLWEGAGEDARGSLNKLAFLLKYSSPPSGHSTHSGWKFILFRLFGAHHVTHDYVIRFLQQNAHLGVMKSYDGCDCLMRLLRNRCYSHKLHAGLMGSLMASRGFDTQGTDKYQNTYVHHLVDNRAINQADFVATLKALLEKGNDINARNQLGRTALHNVARCWKDRLCDQGSAGLQREFYKLEALVEHGASLSLLDVNRKTPLVLLKESKPSWDHKSTVQIDDHMDEREVEVHHGLGLACDPEAKCMPFRSRATSRHVRGRGRQQKAGDENGNLALYSTEVVFGVEPLFLIPDCGDEQFANDDGFSRRERGPRIDHELVKQLTKAAISRLSVQDNSYVSLLD